jgi:DNA-binding CsgD family transcriptional regulator
MFISKVLVDRYMARRSQRSAKLIWSKVPLAPAGLDIRIDERDVPEEIREQAYNMFEADRERDAESLRIRFGLTPAEVRLVLRLITGQSLRSSAESIGIAYETARCQLKLVFLKSGTRRQSELVVAVLSGGGPDAVEATPDLIARSGQEAKSPLKPPMPTTKPNDPKKGPPRGLFISKEPRM